MRDWVQTLARIGADPQLRHGALGAQGVDGVPDGASRGKLYCTVFPVREDEPRPEEAPRREDEDAPAEDDTPAREH